jgi:uncharacterized membrane protein YkvA (DUF1232 family)
MADAPDEHPDDAASALEAERADAPVPPRIEPGVRAARGGALIELVAFLPDVAKLLYRVTRDPRVDLRAKVMAAAAVVYVASPIDIIPDVIPAIGQADDIWLVVRTLRYLVNRAGYDIVRELWPGSDDGFALLLLVAGIER